MNVLPETTLRLWCERVRLLYAHLPFVLGGQMVAALGLATALWNPKNSEFLRLWLLAIVALTLVRSAAWGRYRQLPSQNFAYMPWLYGHALMAFLSGCLWGSVGFFLFESVPSVLMILVVVYAGMVAGSVASHSIWLPAFLLYAIPSVMPFALKALTTGEPIDRIIGVLSLTFLTVNIYYGRNLLRSMTESIRLRFANESLINAVWKAREKAEVARTEAEAAHASAVAANVAKTRFLAAASHDLRQPTQALLLFIDGLQHESLSQRVNEQVQHIRTAANSLQSLLSALMDYAMVESASLSPEPASFALEPLLQRVASEFSADAHARGLTLRLVSTDTWVHSDPKLIERIVRNLIANAIKYTTQGGVLVGCRPHKRHVRLVVYDTGIGIKPALQTEIFKEFFQADNPQRDSRRGLGLGLSIVQGLALQLGHPLGLRSVPGKGSVFFLDLPRAQPQPIQIAIKRSHENDFAQRTVMVVDDDEAILQALRAMLERWECHVLTASSGTQALQKLQSQGKQIPELILADYRLAGGENGVEVIARLRQHLGVDVPAAILTGEIAPQELSEIERAGLLLIHKPIRGGKLRALLNRVLLGC